MLYSTKKKLHIKHLTANISTVAQFLSIDTGTGTGM
jgi:hypothetical protein